jgi:VWFA-related protein
MRTSLSCGVAVALAIASASAQQPPLVLRSGLDLVTVDVRVVDSRGVPVRDLRPEDFAIEVDGRRRQVAVLEFVAYANEARPITSASQAPVLGGAAPAPLPSKTVLLVVDEGNIAPGSARAVVDAAAQFVRRLPASDRVGLLTIPESTAHVDVTADRELVIKGLAKVSGHRSGIRELAGHAEPLSLSDASAYQHDRKRWADLITKRCIDGVYGARVPEPACVLEMEATARLIATDAQQRTVASMRALTSVMATLARVAGPTVLVLLSEELAVADYPEVRADFNAEARRLAEAAARSQTSVYVLQMNSPDFDATSRTASSTPGADSEARLFGLESVTGLTGGRLFRLSGTAQASFDRVIAETSGHYELGFTAEPSDRDGAQHVVRVSVRQPGLDVRARRQFVFPKVSAAPPVLAPARPGADATPARLSQDRPAAVSPLSGTPLPTVDFVTLPGAPVEPPHAGTLEEVLRRAARYVVDYGNAMTTVVGTERYSQSMLSSDASMPRTRTLLSEFALVRVGDDWQGYRDVGEVNGEQIPDRRNRLERALAEGTQEGRDTGRRLADESARFNLGPFQRNFNVPTTALLFLHPSYQPRFKYSKRAEQQGPEGLAWVVSYEETRKPSLIRTSGGRDMPVFGVFWIEPTSGRVLKSVMSLSATSRFISSQAPASTVATQIGVYLEQYFGDNGITTRETGKPPMDKEMTTRRSDSRTDVAVTYKMDARLGLMVPVEMREYYSGTWARRETQTDAEVTIQCVATYEHFKRFGTSVRIVPR